MYHDKTIHSHNVPPVLTDYRQPMDNRTKRSVVGHLRRVMVHCVKGRSEMYPRYRELKMSVKRYAAVYTIWICDIPNEPTWPTLWIEKLGFMLKTFGLRRYLFIKKVKPGFYVRKTRLINVKLGASVILVCVACHYIRLHPHAHLSTLTVAVQFLICWALPRIPPKN
jgi:hypothetical protein